MDGSPPNGYFMFTARTLNSEVQIVIPYGDRYDSITLDIFARRALFGPQVTDSDLSMPPLLSPLSDSDSPMPPLETSQCTCCYICEDCCFQEDPVGCKSPNVPRPKCVNSEIKPCIDEPPTQTLHIRIRLYQPRLTAYYQVIQTISLVQPNHL